MEGNRFSRQSFPRHRKLSSKLIKGIRGCYVCGKNHKARTQHSTQEIRQAIEKLNINNPTAIITVEDFAFISSELVENEKEDDESMVYESDAYLEELERYIAYDLLDSSRRIEQVLSHTSFNHGRIFTFDRQSELRDMQEALCVE